jgi:hypothetical protein
MHLQHSIHSNGFGAKHLQVYLHVTQLLHRITLYDSVLTRLGSILIMSDTVVRHGAT